MGNASDRVWTFSAGFHPGSQFAYVVFITSCTAHSLGISGPFCKTLSNESLKEFTNKRERAQAKEIEVKLFIFQSLPGDFWIMFNSCSCFMK